MLPNPLGLGPSSGTFIAIVDVDSPLLSPNHVSFSFQIQWSSFQQIRLFQLPEHNWLVVSTPRIISYIMENKKCLKPPTRSDFLWLEGIVTVSNQHSPFQPF
jgi:hypothetical protein